MGSKSLLPCWQELSRSARVIQSEQERAKESELPLFSSQGLMKALHLGLPHVSEWVLNFLLAVDVCNEKILGRI